MKPFPIVLLAIVLAGAAPSQDISPAGTFRLQGTVIRRDGDTVLAYSHFNVPAIDSAHIRQAQMFQMLGSSDSWPPGSIAEALQRQREVERDAMPPLAEDYEASMLRWAETGVMKHFEWTAYQRSAYMNTVRRAKLLLVENAPTNLLTGKSFNIVARKTGQRELPLPAPPIPYGPPLPPKNLSGPFLNRITPDALLLMIYKPVTQDSP